MTSVQFSKFAKYKQCKDEENTLCLCLSFALLISAEETADLQNSSCTDRKHPGHTICASHMCGGCGYVGTWKLVMQASHRGY